MFGFLQFFLMEYEVSFTSPHHFFLFSHFLVCPITIPICFLRSDSRFKQPGVVTLEANYRNSHRMYVYHTLLSAFSASMWDPEVYWGRLTLLFIVYIH